MFALSLLLALAAPQSANHASVHGRLLGADGAPVAGAAVVSRVWPGTDFPVNSDADGRFDAVVEWPELHRDTYYSCSVRALGCALWTHSDKLVPGQELDLGTVRLEPGGAVSGRTLLGTSPAAGSRILVVPATGVPAASGSRFDECRWTGPAFVTSGGPRVEYDRPVDRGSSSDDGTFSIVGLPPGHYGLWVRCDASYWAATSAFDVRAGEVTTLADLVLDPLPPEHRIAGVVLAPDGAPVADAEIRAQPVEDRIDCFHLRTRSGSDGTFEFFVLPLSCGPLGLRATVAGGRFGAAEIDSVPPGRHDLVLRLGELRELVVHVVAPDGSPVERFGWRVTHYGTSTAVADDMTSIHPGGAARLRFPPGGTEQLILEAPGYEKAWVKVEPDEREITVTLEGAGLPEIAGRVTHDGVPVSGAHVDLVLEDGDLVSNLIGSPSSGLHYCVPGDCLASDALGLFRFENEWPRYRYRVRAWVEGFAAAYSDEVRGAAEGVVLELTSGGALTGHVRFANGGGKGLALRVHRADVLASTNCQIGRQSRTRADEHGDFRFEHLEPGTWLVGAELSPGELQELGWSTEDGKTCLATPFVCEIAEGATTSVDVDLSQPGGACRLRGKLTVGDQIREGYAYLLLEGEEKLRIAFGGVDASGAFELTTRAPGRYRLVVHAGPEHYGYRLVTDLVDLVPGETKWERTLSLAEWKEDGVRLDRE